jgi:NitT/TauT family transport system permease protein
LVRVLHVPLYLLPPPSAIAQAAVADRSALSSAMVVTGRAALVGFALSGLFGISAGVIMASSRALERAFAPYTVFLQTVPIVAVAPLLVIWFGPGLRAVTTSAVIVSVFPVIAGTLSGIRSVEPAQRDLFRLYRATRLQTLRLLELPSAIPNIITGLRVASGLAVIGAIVGEFVAGFSEAGAGLTGKCALTCCLLQCSCRRRWVCRSSAWSMPWGTCCFASGTRRKRADGDAQVRSNAGA